MNKFSDAQKAAFSVTDLELSVSAGAGSGKTSVLVERYLRAVAEQGIPPSRILAIAFMDKAAAQMRTRLAAAFDAQNLKARRREIENAPIATIHSFCARLLRENPVECGLDPYFRVLSGGEACLLSERVLDALFEAQAAQAGAVELLSEPGETALRESLKDIYDLYRASGGDESIYALDPEDGLLRQKKQFVRLAQNFRSMLDAEKRRISAYDFDDLLYLAHRMLADPRPASAAVRARLRAQYSLILVDEYQDLSPLQDKIIGLLKSQSNLFIVGDLQQSIFGFRYAEPGVFRGHIERHRKGPSRARNVVLAENYRSRPAILSFVNAIFKEIFPASEYFALEARKKFATVRETSVELLCLPSGAGSETDDDSPSSRVREAARLAAWIEAFVSSGSLVEQQDGTHRRARYSDIAVLLRASTHSRIYQNALAERGTPFGLVKGTGFYDKPEILDLVGFMKLLVDPGRDVVLAGVLRSPLFGLSDDALYWLSRRAKHKSGDEPLWRGVRERDAIEQLRGQDRKVLDAFVALWEKLRLESERAGLSRALERLVEATDYEAMLVAGSRGRQRVANVRKLIRMTREFEAHGVVSASELTARIDTLSENEALEPEARLEGGQRDAVLLSTVHGVKGLEFPVVIIADMGSKRSGGPRTPFMSMPGVGLGLKGDATHERIGGLLKAREEAEYWRLLYVAMTRAKEHLVLSGSLSLKAKDGDFNKQSKWLNRICAAIEHHPLKSRAQAIDFHGVRVTFMPAEVPSCAPAPAAPAPEPETEPAALARQIDTRLHTVFKSYPESEDRTVSDLLAQQTPALPEPAEPARVWTLDPDEPELPPNEFGTVFHRVMEFLTLDAKARIAASGPLARMTAGCSAAQRGQILKSAQSFWSGPWGQAVRQARRVYPELPFLFSTPGGLLKGQIDLVFQDRQGAWTVLDYKTHQAAASQIESLADNYRLQLGLYALVFCKLYGQAPKRGVLYFSACGKAHTRGIDDDELRRCAQRIGLDF